jgi:hypothetical protein
VSKGRESGFSLVEALVAMVVITLGLVSMAQLMAVTAMRHHDAREVALGTELGQAKLEELMMLNLATAPELRTTPDSPDSLFTNVAGYFDTPERGITRRWRVGAGPVANTRLVTVRVVDARARQYGSTIDLTTIIRQW